MLHLGDCMDVMQGIPDGSVDLTVTSPPYDNLRTYNGNNDQWGEHVWRAVIADLYRVTADGGAVVWVVKDATIKGSETGTSFKQALWAMECGFNLHDTMIWDKPYILPLRSNRYENSSEYMFVFSKGPPSTANLIKDKPNKGAGRKITGHKRGADGKPVPLVNVGTDVVIAEFGTRHNVWVIDANRGRNGYNHPASFPLQLATDHILSWSNPGDTVLDPFLGSGTTGVAAANTGRRFVGIEMDASYFAIAQARIATAQAEAITNRMREAIK